MQHQATISGKNIEVNITSRAMLKIQQRQQPLVVEMELYFSCLIRKAVRFADDNPSQYYTEVMDNLLLAFNPVMTEICKVDPNVLEPPVTAFPIKKITPYVPKWVRIDYKSGAWRGEFGYD